MVVLSSLVTPPAVVESGTFLDASFELDKSADIQPRQEDVLAKFQQTRDPNDFRAIVKWSEENLSRFILRKVKDLSAVDDILQQTYIRVLNSVDSYDALRGKFKAFMFTIASRLAIDHLRAQARKISQLESAFDTRPEGEFSLFDCIDAKAKDPSDVWQTDTELTEMRAAMAELAEADQTLLHFVFNGVQYNDIHEYMGKPLGTVKSGLSRAREHLADKLRGEESKN